MNKYQYKCCLSSDKVNVDIFSTHPVFLELYRRFSKDPTSGVQISQKTGEANLKIFYKEVVPGKEELTWDENSVLVCAPWFLMNSGENFLYLALPLIEKEKQQKGIVTIHAASCSINGSGILLLGKEGSGKTSIVYKLCKELNAKLIGNDLTMLEQNDNSLFLNSGSKFFFFRQASVERSIRELKHLFSFKDTDKWLTKKKILPREIGIEEEYQKVPLTRAFYVHIDETQPILHVGNANILANKLHLNENFSRYIRNSCTALLDSQLSYWGYIPSFDNETFYKRRLSMIEKLYTDANLCYISGKTDNLVKHISQYYHKINSRFNQKISDREHE